MIKILRTTSRKPKDDKRRPADKTAARARPLVPKGGKPRVNTPEWLAKQIVAHFKPSGRILDPCPGGGAFVRAIPGCEWCVGRDGFAIMGRWDWIVTSPPWNEFRYCVQESLQRAENVVFLAVLNAWFIRARWADLRAARFGIVETLILETPEKPWPQTGFLLAAVHAKRGHVGAMKVSHAPAAANMTCGDRSGSLGKRRYVPNQARGK